MTKHNGSDGAGGDGREAAGRARPAHGRKRILVVNDTKEILELFRDVLETEMGHDVTVMSYAPDELSRIVEHQPDLIIVDFMLGERQAIGWQLLQKLRMHPETAHIPAVACTAAVDLVRESEAYLLEQGIEVVLKPFTIQQLENAVDNALRLPEQSMGLRLQEPGGAKEEAAAGPG
ncbi:MAG TPA: response regulator [Candidatus Limnocylindria bacterium]